MSVDPARLEYINAHETEYLYEEIFVQQAYLPEGMTLPEGATVIDVGANIGMYSLFVHTMFPTAKVYAFEPMPPVLEKLSANLAAHEVCAEVFPYALSDAEGEVEFTYYPGYSTMSADSSHAASEFDREFVRKQVLENSRQEVGDAHDMLDELLEYQFREVPYRCRTRRLSDVVRELGITHIDMLKIDVQRAEADVLRGVDDDHWPLIDRIALEVHDEAGTPTEGRLALLGGLLRERGFTVGPHRNDGVADSGRYSVFASRPDAGHRGSSPGPGLRASGERP
ncbi:FkbM family methyltransferase [Streptomyces sp. NPDC091272]|uniref:FkbM family methyltransferase n=1 Tax=Streptomyces sp. NPDC091272 TaxID=3365981 RepID=UPI0038171CD2